MPEELPTTLLEPLIDAATDALLELRTEVAVGAVALVVAEHVMKLPAEERMQAMVEALVGATGARMERRTNRGRDLVNVSVPGEGRVARWSLEAERLALERRRAREPSGPLDA